MECRFHASVEIADLDGIGNRVLSADDLTPVGESTYARSST